MRRTKIYCMKNIMFDGKRNNRLARSALSKLFAFNGIIFMFLFWVAVEFFVL